MKRKIFTAFLKKHEKILIGTAWSLAALLFWIGIWWLGSVGVNRVLVLPSPILVIRELGTLILTGEFWSAVGHSVAGILAGYAVGVILGAVLAVLCFALPPVKRLISPLLTVIRATPVASFILLTVIFMARPIIPAFMAVLMVLPVIWGALMGAFESTDPELLEMGRAYGFGKVGIIRKIYIPASLPSLISGMATSIGLGWKAGIAAEIISMPSNSIGNLMRSAQNHLETPRLLALTLTVIIISLIFEIVLKRIAARLRGRVWQ